MPVFTLRVPSAWPVDSTFAFMADLRNFERWDPGVRWVQLARGTGAGPDTAYHVAVGRFLRDIVFQYETIEYTPPRRVVVRADWLFLTSLDIIAVENAEEGSEVVYTAGLEFRGILRPLGGLLNSPFERIVNRAGDGLRAALARSDS
ncbi:MAG: SRPBCC family protein [Dehalococcoidia bacterium]